MDLNVQWADITDVFMTLWLYFKHIVIWEETHGICIGVNFFSFFDIAVGVFATWMLVKLIPIFGDPEDEDAIYDDFGGW